MSEPCRVCGTSCLPFGSATLLGDVDATYERCPRCGLVMAVRPDWLDRAYSSAIADLDIGLLDRCLLLSHVTASIIRSERLRDGRFLDWAGGYGTSTRLMRDRGHDFSHHDPMAVNLFAPGYATTLVGESFDLVTGFEVLEHLEDPVASLTPVAATTDRLLLTTQLLPDPAPAPGEWWYYTPETGQHITFHTPESLRILASRLGYDGVASGSFLHLLHRGPVSRVTRALVRRPAVAYGLGLLGSPLGRRRSRLPADLKAVLAAGSRTGSTPRVPSHPSHRSEEHS